MNLFLPTWLYVAAAWLVVVVGALVLLACAFDIADRLLRYVYLHGEAWVMFWDFCLVKLRKKACPTCGFRRANP